MDITVAADRAQRAQPISHARLVWFFGVVGFSALLELLMETRAGLAWMTTGSPLAWRGILVELPGTIWFGVLLFLLRRAKHLTDRGEGLRLNLYTYLWTIVGLAVSIWTLKNADRSSLTNWQYWVAFSCVVAAFLVSGIRDQAPSASLYRFVLPDFRRLWLNRATVGWLCAALALLAFAPRPRDVPSRRAPPLRGAALLSWFDSQPRRALPAEYVLGPVTVVTFIDYQCPACYSAEQLVAPAFESLARELGDTVRFRTMDFPLESECNAGTGIPRQLHPAACEAAVAVRLAHKQGLPLKPLTD